uniref:Thioredoxin domain-containing protein n=1 Tax=viral metagenome TaxID=1070528 RepID=A0A6C0HT58_9ZZZZ
MINIERPNVSKVMEIDDKNISQLKKMLQEGKTCYLLLYADGCVHCDNFKPIWGELSDEMANELTMINAVIAQIENSNMKKMKGNKYFENVRAFPTIRKITKNRISDYTDVREKKNLKHWMRNKQGGSRKHRKKRGRKTKRVYRKTPYPF